MDPQQQQQQLQQQQLQQLQRQQMQQQPINTNVHPLSAPQSGQQPLPGPLPIPPLPLALTIPPLAPDQALISSALASPPAITPVPVSVVKAPTAILLQQQKQLIQEQQRRMSLNATSNSPPAGPSTPTTPVTPVQVGVTPLPLASPVGSTNPVPTTSQLLAAAAAQTRLAQPPPSLPTQDPRITQPPSSESTSLVPENLGTTPAQELQSTSIAPSTPATANPGASTSVPQPLDQKAPPTPTAVPVPVIQPPQPLIKVEDEPLKSSSSSSGAGASGNTLGIQTSTDQQGYPKGEATAVKEPSEPPSGPSTVPVAIAPATEETPSSSLTATAAATSTPPTVLVQIFKATYSGVPVYEMICKGVAVMRRRSDSYLNATQILKVAEFDKPQRTRILEREVQKGEHEKVQGGYGKYQDEAKAADKADE
ncbi:hypothetical protein BG005_006782 [Podila minutissima]|nr:hypothetical protein BG005_006782 [Podila minutissima]